MNVPVKLIRTVWPPNSGVAPGDKQFDALLAAVKADGVIKEPLDINLDWTVIDGCHRLAVARLLGIERVDVRIWTGTEWLA